MSKVRGTRWRSGDVELHAHHKVPKSRGGSHRMYNLVTVCRRCHEQIHGHSIPSRNGGKNINTIRTSTPEEHPMHPDVDEEKYVDDPCTPPAPTEGEPYWEKKKQGRTIRDSDETHSKKSNNLSKRIYLYIKNSLR
ncbi:HNH endonuclease [Haloarcula sp. CBA1131]|uniref:HNH endonuclease n=1 Tax=Haloarcula sp. CBA1131 TaxID=1853686 RepID=UPI001CD9449C|nr:HNH endonuclease signature motif containing protein [Haloarcula sp. CBA1131]